MRRWATTLPLIALLVLGLVGCQESTPSVPQVTPTPSATPFPADTSVPERILERGFLIVGVRYDLPPFCTVTEEGTLAGFDLDLGRELAQRWLGDPQAVQFRQLRSDTAVAHLQAGDVDIVLAGLVHTQELEELVDFGPAYFWDGHALLVHASDAVSITTPADLAGRRVGVVAAEGAGEMLASMVVPSPTLQTYTSFEQALMALGRREVDAASDLRRRLVRGLTMVPDTVVVGQYTTALVAPAYAHDEPGLNDLLAFTLEDMVADGTYGALYARWFPGDAPPTPELLPGTATLSLEEAATTLRGLDTLASIQSGGWLRVAMVSDRYPFAFVDTTGTPSGYEVHLVQNLAEHWLGDRTAVEFVPVTPEDGLRMVATGQVDMLIGAVPQTREAALQVDFSLTTYIAGQGLMMIGADTTLGGIEGLNGQTVATVSGTESADVLRQVGQELGISVAILPKTSLEEAIAALEAGEVLAIVGERMELLGPSFDTPGAFVSSDRLTSRPLALALPPGDSAFRDLVNLTLQAMARDGQLGTIYGVWFDDELPPIEPWPGEPTRPLRLEITAPYSATISPGQ
jgi:polar amino acid transport system substrate-binding protein